MSVAGIPPFGGFWSKLLIIFAAVQAGRFGYAVWAVLAGVLTLGYLTRALRHAFGGPLPDCWRHVQEVPVPMQVAMVVLAFVCLAGGLLLLPSLNEVFVHPASQVLLNGVAYAKIFGGI
jgi:multicomponent Na+:H+ antiporter subunit D